MLVREKRRAYYLQPFSGGMDVEVWVGRWLILLCIAAACADAVTPWKAAQELGISTSPFTTTKKPEVLPGNATNVGTDPLLHIEGYQDGGIKVACTAEQWPKGPTLPELQWKDDSGKILPDTSKSVTPADNGLFNIESVIIARRETNKNLSCCILDFRLVGDKESKLYIAETFFQRVSRCGISRYLVGLSFLILWIVLVALIAFLCRKESKSRGKLSQKIEQLKKELEWRKVRSREDDVTWDRATVPDSLEVSADGRSVSVKTDAPRDDQGLRIALGSRGYTADEHYWEVDVGNETTWSLGIVEEPAANPPAEPASNQPVRYWGLRRRHNGSYETIANATDPTQGHDLLEVTPAPIKVGVYTNYKDGTFTIYSVRGKCQLFTRPTTFSGTMKPFLCLKNVESHRAFTICRVPEWE